MISFNIEWWIVHGQADGRTRRKRCARRTVSLINRELARGLSCPLQFCRFARESSQNPANLSANLQLRTTEVASHSWWPYWILIRPATTITIHNRRIALTITNRSARNTNFD
ncbi:hypothetical protein FQG32_01530 [Escherichia coli]|nr:hypothetical protein [Escherichia coli]